MNIAILVNTPAQLHFYKNIYYQLVERGHRVFLMVRYYGETKKLLNKLKISSYLYSLRSTSKINKILYSVNDILKLVTFLNNKNIDVVTGFGIYDPILAKMINAKGITFLDSETSINITNYITQRLTLNMSDIIITPDSFREELGNKQIKVNSYKELAYLHPNYYKPNDHVYDILNLDKNEKYILFRYNILDALHDISVKGFNMTEKIKLIKELEEYGKIFISFEGQIPKKLIQYSLRIPQKYIHDVINYASLLITDTQTMATEAAILGTPVIRCNSFVGKNDMGVFIELENRYHLLYNFKKFDNVLLKSHELLNDKNIEKMHKDRRNIMLQDKVDMTKFMVNLLINNSNNSVRYS